MNVASGKASRRRERSMKELTSFSLGGAPSDGGFVDEAGLVEGGYGAPRLRVESTPGGVSVTWTDD